MRTTFSFFFPTSDPDIYRGIAEDCVSELVDIELSISPYQEGSDIHRINMSAGTGEWIRIGWPTYHLLQLCVHLMKKTNGAFNPFDGHRTMQVSGKVLDEQTLRILRQPNNESTCAILPLELDQTNPQCRLAQGSLIDLGGIGKGWALDKCAAIANDAGIDHGFFNAGGSSMIAIGSNWPIRVAGTDRSETLSNQALSVSRLVNADAGGIHIIGRSHFNLETDIVCRVIGKSCAVTDALSTAGIAGNSYINDFLDDYDVVINVLASPDHISHIV